MKAIFTVDYNDGKIRAKAGAVVPDSIPAHRLGVLLKAKMARVPDPLDHDGDGVRGGSLPGEQSTVAKGRRRRK